MSAPVQTNPVSALKQIHLTPQIITGYFLRLIQNKFSDKNNQIDESLRNDTYVYHPTDGVAQTANTGILITTPYKLDIASMAKRPAVLVARASLASDPPTSIGSRWQTPTNLIGNGHHPNAEATLGQNQVLNTFSGSHVFYCIAEEAAAAEILGTELLYFFTDYERAIVSDLGLMRLRAGELNRPTKVEEYKTNWVVTFTLSYNYQRAAVLSTESPLLKYFTAVVE